MKLEVKMGRNERKKERKERKNGRGKSIKI
jgi:hypothetical protein